MFRQFRNVAYSRKVFVRALSRDPMLAPNKNVMVHS